MGDASCSSRQRRNRRRRNRRLRSRALARRRDAWISISATRPCTSGSSGISAARIRTKAEPFAPIDAVAVPIVERLMTLDEDGARTLCETLTEWLG